MKALVTLLDRDGDHIGVAEYDSETRSIKWEKPKDHPRFDTWLSAVLMPDGKVELLTIPKNVWPGDTAIIAINGH